MLRRKAKHVITREAAASKVTEIRTINGATKNTNVQILSFEC
jgi:hypothetical protein